MKLFSVVAIVFALSLLLAGCTQQSAPTPSPTVVASATPLPTVVLEPSVQPTAPQMVGYYTIDTTGKCGTPSILNASINFTGTTDFNMSLVFLASNICLKYGIQSVQTIGSNPAQVAITLEHVTPGSEVCVECKGFTTTRISGKLPGPTSNILVFFNGTQKADFDTSQLFETNNSTG